LAEHYQNETSTKEILTFVKDDLNALYDGIEFYNFDKKKFLKKLWLEVLAFNERSGKSKRK